MKVKAMLNYIIIFFVLAIVAAFFGFSGIAMQFALVAKILTFLFVVLFVTSLLYNVFTGRRANPPL